MLDTERFSKIKMADLLSSLGAGMLGAGIGLLLSKMLAGMALPLLLAGLVSHSVGMFDKHLWEQDQHASIVWAQFLYWLCWLILAALLIYIVIHQL